jgi:hypothetical protein
MLSRIETKTAYFLTKKRKKRKIVCVSSTYSNLNLKAQPTESLGKGRYFCSEMRDKSEVEPIKRPVQDLCSAQFILYLGPNLKLRLFEFKLCYVFKSKPEVFTTQCPLKGI